MERRFIREDFRRDYATCVCVRVRVSLLYTLDIK